MNPSFQGGGTEELAELCAQVLGGEGPLAGLLPGFAPRTGQVEMARACARALQRQVPLLVEAGTGTGKTLAYLVPAVLSGLKVVISTGTKTLQDQVAEKELPLLKKALDPELRWAVLKGRANYLCRRRYESFARQPELGLPGAAGGLAILEEWLQRTLDGDLDQVRGQGLSAALLGEVTATSEQCLGGRCPRREDCFLVEARRRAAEARVVVVNHHLFLADLRLKAEGHGEALPRYQAVVFDEAHLLPEIATTVFGVSVSRRRLGTLLRDVQREAGKNAAALSAAQVCEAAGKALFGRLRRLGGGGGSVALGAAHLEGLAPYGGELAKALLELARRLEGGGEEEQALGQRAAVLAAELGAVAEPVPGHTVAWARVGGSEVSLNLSPVEVGAHLEAALYVELSRLVFTSATLSGDGDLEPMRRRLGLDQHTEKLVVASPFEPQHQALLYVPRQMPPPGAREFPEAVAREVERLVELSRGRAFVLFTSRRNLEAVSRALAPRLPYPCLVQGQAPRMELLRRFVEHSPSVLFATAGFWQGVDVPGPALSAVIVDKLPFAPPDDPLVAARMELLEKEGRSGFAHLMLPEAILALRQGLGRLLRTPEDRGLLAVLDSRLFHKGYGRRFLKALAPVPVTRELEEVARFFAEEGREGS